MASSDVRWNNVTRMIIGAMTLAGILFSGWITLHNSPPHTAAAATAKAPRQFAIRVVTAADKPIVGAKVYSIEDRKTGQTNWSDSNGGLTLIVADDARVLRLSIDAQGYEHQTIDVDLDRSGAEVIRMEPTKPVRSAAPPEHTKSTPVSVAPPVVSPAPTQTASPPTTTNNAPQGMIFNGGVVIHPEIHNNRNPLPEIQWAPHTLLDNGEKDYMNRTKVSVSVGLKGTFYNPAFIATCNVQCDFVEVGISRGNMIQSHGGQQAIASDDFLKAGVVMTESLLTSGTFLLLTFRSAQPGALLKITDVQPYALTQ